MMIHWSHRSLPELSHLTKGQRDEVWKRCVSRSTRRWQSWALLMPLLLVIGGAQLAFILVVIPWVAEARGGLPASMVIGACLGLAQAAVMNAVVVAWLRSSLARELPGRCHACGYDLTGNASGRCPECGGVTTDPN